MSHSTSALALTTHTRNRLLALLGVLAVLGPSLVFSPWAEAALDAGTLGGFEIDGDTAVTTTGNRDWQSAGAQSIADATDASDDIFVQSSKEADDPYVFDVGNSPDKNNLSRVYLDWRVTGDDDAYIWLGFERLSGNGDAFVAFEFNQARTADFHTRSENDLRINYNYTGQGQTDDTSVSVDQWDGDSWEPITVGDTASTINTTAFVNGFGDTIDPREFGEAGIDLSFLFADANFTCANFSTIWARTRSSQSDSANVFDRAGPFGVDVDLCSTLKVQKQDAEGRGLSGAEFELWLDDGDGSFETAQDTLIVVDDSTDPDTTTVTSDANGWAEWDDLDRGNYFVREVVAPTGYALTSPAVAGPYFVDYLTTFAVPSGTFTNPRIPYRIDVSPHDDVNPIGDNSLHTFTVSVEQNIDGTWGDVADGTAVGVAWNGDGSIQTNGCAAGTVAGECTVTVDSADPGAGTLTATFDTPYQHVTGTYGPPEPTTAGWVSTEDAAAAPDRIADAGDKAWRGFLAKVEADDANLVGEQHTFTVTVWETPDGTTAGALASGVDATLLWTAPDGATSTLNCSTGAAGTCTVDVNSTSTGTGFVQITRLDGTINAIDITVTYTATTSDPAVADDRFASKTWVDFRVAISPESATNHVDWDHTFVVTVERDSGAGFVAVDGVDVTPQWKGPGDAAFADLAPCTTSTTTEGAGTCRVTVLGGTLGTGTLRVTELDGAPLSSTVARNATIDVTDATATKTWIDYGVVVTPSDVNLLGEPHDFTVTVSRSDDPADLGGVDVDWTWTGPAGSTVDSAVVTSGTCTTDADGECTLSVDSTTNPGTGVLTVTGLTDDSIKDTDGTSATASFAAVADPDASETDNAASKTWVDFAVDIDPDTATNHVDDGHTFVITVTRDSGNGPVAVDGVTLTPQWQAPGSSTWSDLDPCVTSTTTEGAGTCLVTRAGGTTGTGTLRVTELDGAPLSTTVDRNATIDVTDASATKTWVDYDATISADSVNLVGEDHAFVVTATRDSGSGSVATDGLTVTAAWLDGPTGSTLDTTTCVTSTTTEHGAGTCVFTVSSDATGTGTLHVVSVSEDIGDAPGGSLTETFAAAATPSAISSTKTWVSFTVTISDDADNHVDDDHVFTVRVTRDDGGQLSSPVKDAIVQPEWQAPGSTDWVSLDSCTTGTDGTCDVEVTSGGVTGTGTIRVASLGGAPLSSTVSRDATISGDALTGDAATKTWHDYEVEVSADARNVLGDAHEFVVTAYHDAGTGDGLVATDGLSVTVAWDGQPAGSTIDTTSCTTATDAVHGAGTCVFTVDSDQSVGTGTIAVASVSDPNTLDPDGQALGETYTAQDDTASYPKVSTKTWVGWSVDAIGDFFNPVGDPHTFTLTVREHAGGAPVPAADGTTVTFAWTGTGQVVAGPTTCDSTGTVDGLCTVTVDSSSPGTGTLSVTAVSGTFEDAPFTFTLRPLTVDGLEGARQGTKTWGDFAVTVDPDGVNPIETTHTFTVTTYGSLVPLGDGAELPLLGGQTVELVLSGSATDTSVAPVGEIRSVDDSIIGFTAASCTTDPVTATCTVVITSDVVGTDHLHALYAPASIQPTDAGADPIVFTGAAQKQWVSNPDIAVTKSASITRDDEPVDGPAEVGDVIEYSYAVTNTGDVRLTEVALTDVFEVNGVSEAGLSLLAVPATLAVGETRDLGVLHTRTVTQADLPGPIDNVVTARGTSPDGQEVSDTADQSVELTFSPSINLTKTADVDSASPGEVIEYTYVITNTGDVTLTDVDLNDDVLGAIIGRDGVSALTLAPGESITTVVRQTVTEADLPGPLVNTAVTTGTPPVGPDVDDEAVESVDLTSTPAIEVVKNAEIEPNFSGLKLVAFEPNDGDDETVDYTYVVTNTGGVTLTDVTLVDDVLGTVVLADTTLAPGQSTTGTATHVVTQQDADRGDIVNEAVANGTGPDGTVVEDRDTETVDVTVVLPTIVERPDPEPEPAPDPIEPTTLPRTGTDAHVALLAFGMIALGVLLVHGTPGRRRRPGDQRA